MRFLRYVLFAWVITGLGAGAGFVIGGFWEGPGRFIGATVMATFAVLLVVRQLANMGWLDPERTRGATIGGLVGLTLAAPLAQMELGTAIPLIALGLVPLVMILAAGWRSVR